MNAPTDVAVLATVKAEEAAVVAAQIVEDVRQASAEPAWLAATRRERAALAGPRGAG